MNLNKLRQPNLFQITLKGGALYIAIFISIIIGIFLSLLVLLSYHNSRTANNLLQATQLKFNLASAFEMAQSAYFTEEVNNVWIKNSFNDDSIRVKKYHWGAYLLLHAETKNRHQSLSQAGIYGTFMNADTALMIADNSRPVGLSGKVEFKSFCYLPKAGIKPAFIEGQSYQGNAANGAYIRSAPGTIPSIEQKLVKGLQTQQQLSPYLDSLVYDIPPHYSHSFSKKTMVLEVSSQIIMNKKWQNNIKLVSNGFIEVDSTCHLENILIVAKKVKFRKGFKGRVNVIASDSIIADEKSFFQYPSSMVVLSDGSSNNSIKAILFNKDCKFYGGILAINNSTSVNGDKVFIKLNASTQINGLIYSSNYIHIEGQLNATVIANSLLLSTPSAVYENHMINCEFNPKKWAHVLSVPLLFNANSKLKCCQKINT